MLKKLLIYFSFSILILSSFANGYFEYKYRCSIDKNKTIISFRKENDNFKKCLDIFREVDFKLSVINKNIELAEDYIKKGESVSMWTNILKENQSKKKHLEFFRDDLYNKVEIFEKKLFSKIKYIIIPYINKDYIKFKYNLIKLKHDYKLGVLKGDYNKILSIKTQFDDIELKISLLDKIKSSKNFEELIPALRHYLRLVKNKK